MSHVDTYWMGVIIGVFAGWFLHDTVLQIAYKLGIVKYIGVNK